MNQRKALYQTQPILKKAVDEIPHLKDTGYSPDGLFMRTNKKKDIEIIVVNNSNNGTHSEATPHSIWLILLQLAYTNPELTIIQKADDRFTLAKPTEFITGKELIRLERKNEISFFDLFLICKRNLKDYGSEQHPAIICSHGK